MQGRIFVDLEYGKFDVSVAIDYVAQPGQPMIKYLLDGSGDPGCPPQADMVDVTVLSMQNDKKKWERNDSETWEKADKIARAFVEQKWSSRFEKLCVQDAFQEWDE
jgi:hypothetical protein